MYNIANTSSLQWHWQAAIPAPRLTAGFNQELKMSLPSKATVIMPFQDYACSLKYESCVVNAQVTLVSSQFSAVSAYV